MSDYIKNKIEAQRKIQEQIEIEYRSRRLLPDVDNHLNKEYVDKMPKEQKTSVNIELDPDLLEKIDQGAAQELRTRKAQVLYIIREHFNRQEKKLKEIEKIRKETEDFEKPWNKIKLLENNNKTKPEEK